MNMQARAGTHYIRLAVLLAALLVPPLATAHPGWGLVVDSKGTIYFTDLERVWRIDIKGGVSVFVEDVHTHALYLDEDDALYGEHEWYDSATDTFQSSYWKATPDGHRTSIAEDEAARFFERWDAEGNRYRLTNDQKQAVIMKTSAAGTTQLFAGGPFGYADGTGRQARFRLFGTSVWGPDACIYFTNGGLVRKMALDGTITTVAGPDDGLRHSVQGNGQPRYSALLGLAVAEDGTVFFADIDQRKVFSKPPNGPMTALLDGGQVWMPSGLALVGSDLYVLEYRRDFAGPTNRIGRSGPRVRKIAPDGTVTVVGTADR